MPLANTKPKGRAAGNDDHYTFQAEGHPDILLPSVTSIIKAVFNAPFQPAAYWGAQQAIKWEYTVSKRGEQWEQAYIDFKASDHAPNANRDRGATRGTKAHEILECLANGTEVPPITTKYDEAVHLWWKERMVDWTPLLVERALFWVPSHTPTPTTYRLRNHPAVSFDADPAHAEYLSRHGYAGTADLFRSAGGYVVDGLDLKTHKPPVRFEDHLQIAAYGEAALQMGLIDTFDRNTVVLAKENGKYKEEERWVDPDAFHKVRSVYREKEGS